MNKEAADAVAEEIVRRFGVKAVSNCCNVTSKAQIDAMVEEAVKTFGRIDILNHVAGVFGAVDFLEATEEDYDKQLNVNTKGNVLCGSGRAAGDDSQPCRQDRQHVLSGGQVRIPHQCGVYHLQIRCHRHDAVHCAVCCSV